MTSPRAVRWAAILAASIQTVVAGIVVASVVEARISSAQASSHGEERWDALVIVLLVFAAICSLTALTFGPRLRPRIHTGARFVARILAVAQLGFGAWLVWRLVDKWSNGERFPRNWIEASWLLIIAACVLGPVLTLLALRGTRDAAILSSHQRTL